jgi:hypothetical protein
MAISCGAVALAISFWMEEDPVGESAAKIPAEGNATAAE